MHGKVKRLRTHGKRLTDREIARAEPVEGELSLCGHQWSMEYVLTIRMSTDVANTLLPPLYGARLLSMGHARMLFRGEERPAGEEGPSYVQEWVVEIGRL